MRVPIFLLGMILLIAVSTALFLKDSMIYTNKGGGREWGEKEGERGRESGRERERERERVREIEGEKEGERE